MTSSRKQMLNIPVEFENAPPTADDAPRLTIHLLARWLVNEYEKEREKKESEKGISENPVLPFPCMDRG